MERREKREQSTQPDGEVDKLLSVQRAQFRALNRALKDIRIQELSERWEIEDKLKVVNDKWKVIDETHIKIDSIICGADITYEDEYEHYEKLYEDLKRSLNCKLSSSIHLKDATPKFEIPTFSGNYTQWPSFFDLFGEAIHSNNSISKAQKLLHLKSKLKGEAERLIQHLHISNENYDSAWEILVHRYENKSVLFSKQIEIFLNQPSISKQTSFELKRLYATTTECIHAIYNLGVDTASWDPLLVHLLCKKLDPQTYIDYKESRKSPRDLANLDEFLRFIENKFIALEPISRKEKEFPTSSSTSNQTKNVDSKQSRPFYQPIKSYQVMASYIKRCPLCNLQHDLFQCEKFLNMTPDTKLCTADKLRVCSNCLYQHNGKPCTSTKRCKKCNGEHNTILHEACDRSVSKPINQTTTPIKVEPKPSTEPFRPSTQRHVFHVANENRDTLLPTVIIQIKAADGTFIPACALLDQAAQTSLISENLVQALGLKRHHSTRSTLISGIDLCKKEYKGVVHIHGKSAYDDHQFQTEAFVVSKVSYNLPQVSFEPESLDYLKNLQLADPQFNISQKIDLLLHSDIYSEVIREGLIKGPPRSPIAQKTTLGWIISGSVKTMNCFAVAKCTPQISPVSTPRLVDSDPQSQETDLSRFWEVEDISTSSNLTEEERFCEEFYQQTTERLADGRYILALPMKPNYENQLGSSKSKAIAQFKQLENKMNKNTAFSESYKQFMREYIALDHMRLAQSTDERDNYLPHHGVFKSDLQTGKKGIRVVFNASSKTADTGKSLNDLMYSGPNLQQDLQALILKWRTFRFVITADVEKMFRQFLIRESDQHLQMVVWRESPHEHLQAYQLTTVTYGTKAAPFLAMRTLKQLARDEAQNYPLGAAAVESSFYTDDLLTEHNNMIKLKKLQQEIIKIFQSAKMNLRKWSSNDSRLLNNLADIQNNDTFEFKCMESRKTLGLQWNPTTDCFSYKNQITDNTNERITKRQLLSEVSKIFDPLGWLSPLSIRAKLLFQKTWSKDMTWNDTVSKDVQKEWIQLKNDLKDIEDFKIPRHVGNTEAECQLHAFCDASESNFSCVVYLVTKNNAVCTSKIIVAKTRLAPLAKKVTIPRLELCGALLLSQLLKKVLEAFHGIDVKVHAWTDSMIVLGWLKGDISRWKQFVANRVKQINDIIPPTSWEYVKSEENPADCATRGLSKNQLLEQKLWWEGPEWLPSFTSADKNINSFPSPDIEVKRVHCVNAALQQNNTSLISELIMQYSSLTRATKVLGWVSRFISCVRDRQGAQRDKSLTSSELKKSFNAIIKQCQQQDFKSELEDIKSRGNVSSKSKIASISPYIDELGLLRVGGRLRNAELSDSAKHPIILSAHNKLTDLIIHQAHITTLHGGARLTLSYIRNKFWIISGMRTVKRQLRRCVRCRRFSNESAQNIMGDLPEPRVTPSRPFTHTGVDFTGFVELKINKGRGIKTCKGYVAVFVCLATKAVHLELVSDMSTPTFLAAFRRFCARRATPKHMYSDNGSNFIGGNRLLKTEYKEIIKNINAEFFRDISEFDIEWHFNAPAWPSAGGLWESAVGKMKYHLKRVLGDQKLTFEEFTTLLHQIEACMNSRPLYQLTECPDDSYLTPGHFLVGGPLLSRPQTEPNSITLSKRWQLVQAMNKHFWKRWSAEYLQLLQTRSRWRTAKRNLEVDDVVIIKEENLPPGKWALGRVVDTFPGKDGYVRVVSLKTSNNIIKRPVSKLIRLPVRKEDQETDQQTPGQLVNQTSPPHHDQTNTASANEQPRPQRRRALNIQNFIVSKSKTE